ncbi:phist protein [Plasmodium cynomolgi strain B]|uniref:Phist protein n=1 Tax=Plasmodium cynomolgi (strain B) TaxID=1120755 RepID=K6UCS8_PLACD|nr:phist protein [Plasmodium cynomolgi strain B]GAB65376.1 phist protein [Plasmodium cynomolgi strain B]
MEMTNERGNPSSRKGSNRWGSSFFRILNIAFIGLLILAVEHGETYEKGKARRLACPNSSKTSPGGGGLSVTEENGSLFDSAQLENNNQNNNSSQDMYGLSQLLCRNNKRFIRNRKKEGRSAEFTNEGGSSTHTPSICWDDGVATTSSGEALEEAHDEIEPRRNRFIQKGYFEYMNHAQELSETEFIEKISNLGDYADPEEMSSIFYYVHTNERKKYFVMQENVITHWENLCHNYNVKEEFKNEQMRSLYEESTYFFLFKEKQFLKSFSKFVRFGRYNSRKFIDGLVSYKRLWKEYRRMVNNFCSAKLDEVLKAYWEENREEASQMRIQY